MALSGSIKTNSYEGRYYKLEWTATQSIAENTSIISWTISCSGGSASWYAERDLRAVIDGTAVYSKYSRVERKKGTIKTGVFTVQHDTYGKKDIEMSLKVACYTSSVNLKASDSFTLDDIPRLATITSAPNFTDEENPTITYNNPAGEAVEALQVCISFDKTAQNIAYRDVSKTGNSYTFNFTDAERAVLYNGTTTANSRTVYFYIKTTIGGENHYSSLAKTLTIADCMPTINPTIYDSELIEYGAQSEWYNPTGDTNEYFIKGWSDATYAINAEAKKGASIVSQKVECGNKSSTEANGTIEDVDRAIFSFTATDIRGNTVEKTIDRTLINYFKPTMNLEVSPPTAQGELEVNFSGKWYNGSIGTSNNKWRIFYIVIEEDGTIIEQYDIVNLMTINGNDYSYSMTIPDLNYKATYTIYAYGYDTFYSLIQRTETVKLLPVFDWGKDDFKFNVPVSGLEGEWIPTLNSSAISSYTNQKGWYIKSGNVVNAGFYIKATCNSGKESTSISIGGLPFKPTLASAGGGMCSGAYVSGGFTFQCWVAGTDGNITARVQQVNHTTATNLATSASGCFYRSNGGEITLSGTITYITE